LIEDTIIVMETSRRRRQISCELSERTGINEDVIKRLVHAFYAKARKDDLLGPIFDSRVGNWDLHLERMCAFWSSVALMSGRYHGRPMEKHLPLPVDSRHFDRWLALFRQTTVEVCSPIAAAHLVECAERIAESLELGVAGKKGVLLAKGERFRRPDAEVYLNNTEVKTQAH
jgi:hemoglobin